MVQSRVSFIRRPSLALAAVAAVVGLLSTGGSGAVASNHEGDGSYLALGDSVLSVTARSL